MGDAISEYDMVALLVDLAAYKLQAGQTGAVVVVHDGGNAFEVEFPLTARDSVIATVERQNLLKLKGEPYARTAG